MRKHFPPGLEMKVLRIVANMAEGGAITASDLGVYEGQACNCLQFVYDNRWVAGRPRYSNGNDGGILGILDARLTFEGKRHLESNTSQLFVCAANSSGRMVWFEHAGPVTALSPDCPELLRALEQLLAESPRLQDVKVCTNAGVEFCGVNFGDLGYATANLKVRGRPGYLFFR